MNWVKIRNIFNNICMSRQPSAIYIFLNERLANQTVIINLSHDAGVEKKYTKPPPDDKRL